MTTSVVPQDERRRAEIAARTRLAWSAYRTAVAGTTGREYEQAEVAAWDELQVALALIDEPRAQPPL